MKKILWVTLPLILVSCYTQERNCTDFRTGTFIFEQEIDGEHHTSTFVRTEEYQIETYQEKTDTASVRWINDCEFILQKINPKNMAEEKGIHMKILTTSRSEEHTSELQSRPHLVCRLLLEKKKLRLR